MATHLVDESIKSTDHESSVDGYDQAPQELTVADSLREIWERLQH